MARPLVSWLQGSIFGKKQTQKQKNRRNSSIQANDKLRKRLELIDLEERLTPATPIQFFYVPLPEQPTLAALETIGTGGQGTSMTSFLFITATENGTVISYDHWEDRYETDLGKPLTSTTQIWGDNDPSNGIAPNMAVDIIDAGTIIRLRNDLPAAPRDPSKIFFDGGDRIGSNKTLAMSRAQFPVTNGSVLTSSVEVRDTRFYDTAFRAPVGANTPNAGQMFEYSAFFVMASQDNTTIQIDANNDGTFEQKVTVNQGQNVVSSSIVQQGGRVLADKPVQVHLLTGDTESTYASRSYALFSNNQITNDYFTPVGRVDTADPVRLFVYNPNASTITINTETKSGAGTSINVAAGASGFIDVTSATGTRLSSTSNFIALGTYDQQDTVHDWGFSLQPVSSLSQIAIVGLGVGNSSDPPSASANTSPIWVTPLAATRVYVDYDGNPATGTLTDPLGNKYNQHFDLARLQSQRVYDNTDNDNSGMRLYTLSGTLISTAWGESSEAPLGSPGFDAGTTIPALPVPEFYKLSDFAPGGDLNGDGFFNSGDRIRYTLQIRNIGTDPIANALISDVLPTQVTYVAGTTFINQGSGAILITDNGSTAFPLDESGYTVLNMSPGNTTLITFDVTINSNLPAATTSITNLGLLEYSIFRLPADNTIGIRGGISGRVYSDVNNNGIFDAGDQAISGAQVVLTGTDDIGTITPVTLTSLADGTYTFTNLRPGTYSVTETQPAGYFDGLETRNNTAPIAGTVGTDVISSIVLGGGQLLTNHNFGEVLAASVAGKVYRDLNANGIFDGSDTGIGGVQVTLSGTNDLGAITPIVVTTLADGSYSFTNLRPGTYTVAEQQPTGLADGKETAGSVGGSTAVNDKISNIVLGAGVNATGYLFAEFPYSSVSGLVFIDTNNNGTQDAGENGIGGVSIQITGTDAAGNAVNLTTTTIANGTYQFTNLAPSDATGYTIIETQPTNYGDGKDTAGSAGGNTTVNDQISGIVLNPGVNATGYTFGERGAVLGGEVFIDKNGNGVQDAGELGLGSVTVNLLNSSGTVIGTTTTGSDGKYNFFNLLPGTYAVEVIVPATYAVTSKDQGSDNTIDSDIAVNGKTSNVTLLAGEVNQTIDGGLYQLTKIGDFIWEDLNANGKQDAGEPGINGATVNLLNSGGSVIGTTTTASDGKYSFENLAPGTYTVQVVASGYVPTAIDQGSDDTIDSDIAANGKSSSITLLSGESTSTIDGGLYQTVTIGDFVWDDLDADGKQDAGEPGINGVTVNLLDSTGAVVGTTTTGSDGKYTFANLTPGTYAVQVVAPTGYLLSPSGNDNALGSNGKTSNVTLTSGQTNNTLDGGLYQTVTIGDFVWDDLDADGKQDAGEPGINGVTVNLLDASGNVIGTTTTGSDGKYTFANLTPGTYAVQVVAPSGYLLSPSGNDNALGSNGKTSNVTLTSGQTNNALDGGLYQTVTIGDFVWDDLDADGKQDAGEPGINGVTVNLLDSTGAVVGTTTTGSDGKYTFANLTPGTYAVQVVAPTGYLLSPSGNDNALGSNGKTSNVTLTSGQTNNTLDGGLYQTVTIGDFVWDDLDADGKQDAGEPGINGVTVNLLDASGNVIGTTTTGSDGKYTFANLTPGTYAVQVVAPSGYLLSPSGNDNALGSNGKTSNVTLTSGQTNNALDGGLYQTVTIGDFVWDDLDADGKQDAGEPGINGVTVNLLDASGNVIGTTTTGSDGKYTFANLTPGTYAVQVVAPSGYLLSPSGNDNALGSNGKTSNVTLTSGQTNNALDGGLYQTVTIGDFVWDDLDADGKQDAGEPGINGVTVNLLDASGNVIGTTTTGSDGKYTFANLTPGTYAVQVVAPSGYLLSPSGNDNALGSNGKTSNVTLTSGQTNNALDGGLYQTVTIGDFVWDDLDADGKQDAGEPGINGVTVNLLDASGNVIGTTTTGSDGKYTFANLTPGTYAVQVVAPTGYLLSPSGNDNALGSNGKTSNVTLTSGQTNNTLDGGLYQTVTIGDFVWDDLDADGKQDAGEPGINGVTVNLLDASGNVIGTTTTGSDGKYTFANLTPGTYAVQVVAPTGYLLSPSGNDNALGSNGKTSNVTLTSGQTNNTLDGGLYQTVTIGDFVWDDLDADGKQDAGEPGINGVTVNLLDASGNVIGTTTTGSDGKYTFANLTPGTYAVQVVAPSGYLLSPSGNDNALGSNGKTSNVTLTSGQTNNALDGGLYQTVTIGDFVWDDLDADGKQDAGEPGINGVTVNLLDASGNVIGTTTTGSDGKYTFANLTPGTYAVQVVAPSGYLLSPSGNDNALGSNGKTSNVTLTSGQTNNALDGGLYQTVTIGDFVWDDLDADGKQDAGEPGINGVTVNLLDSTGAVVGTTTTGSDGKYTFANLTPGTYAVQVVAPSGYLLSPSGNDNALGSNGKTSNVTLTSGQTNNALDGGLYQTVTIGDFVWDDLDADGKQDAGEPGINGVTVNLLDSTGAVVGTTTTGSDGKYTFANLTPGTYAVQVVAPSGYLLSPSGNDNALGSNGKTSNVTLTSGQTNNALDGGLYQTVTIGDFVWDDLDADGKQDAGEPGINGVTVNLLDSTGAVVGTTTTGSDGKYTFANLTPGTYAVQVVAPTGYLLSPSGNDNALGSNGKTSNVTLTSGQTNNTLDGGLYQTVTIGDFVWDDLDADGKQDAGEPGINGVTVNLLDSTGAVVGTTTTGSDGKYTFANLTPGTYAVQVVAPSGYLLSPSGNDNALGSNGKTSNVTLTSGQTNNALDGGLYQTVTIGDFVWDDLDADGKQDAGEPGINGVTVNLLDSTGAVVGTTTTGSDGKYTFANLTPGTYAVQVVAPTGYLLSPSGNDNALGSNGKTSNVTLTSGQTNNTLDGGLYQTVTIGDFVWDDLDADGKQDAGEPGINGVTVNLLDASGNVIGTTTTGSDGKYTFANLTPGTYAVQVVAPSGYLLSPSGNDNALGSNGKTSNVTLTSGQTNNALDGGLYQTVTIGDFVWDDLDADGKQDAGEPGINGVTVNLLDASGNVIGTTTTGSDGKYTFANLTPGTYAVQVVAPTGYLLSPSGNDNALGSNGKTSNVTLTSGQTNNALDGGLYQTVTIGDFVWDDLDADGKQDAGEPGINGVTVNLLDASGNVIGTTTTGSDGKYTFANLTPGTYAVQVVAPSGYLLSPSGNDNALGSNGKTSNVTLTSGQTNNALDGGLYQTVTIGDFVWDDLDADGKQDAGEPGINGVTVNLLDSTGAVVGTTTTGSDGKYTFANLTPGTYAVQVVAPSGYLLSPSGNDNALGSNGKTSNVTLTSGQTNNALDGGLYQTVTIGDFVWDDLDADGKQDAGEPGINGVTVNLLDSTGAVVGTTTTGSDGKYTFANLTPGTYAVQVVAPSGYLLSPSGNDNALGSNGKTSNVTLTSGQTNNALDGGLYQTVTIGDFVWDDLDADGKQDAGEPGINGVTVNLLDASGNVIGTTTTGSDGKYTFANLTPGTYAVQVVAPSGYLLSPSGNDNALGSNGKTSNVTLTSGQTNNALDGGLYQTVTIGDFVWDDLDADGKQDAGEPGINGVTVNLLDSTGAVVGTTTTGSDGKYTFANLTPGTYAVQVVAPSGYLLSPSGNDNALGSNGKTSNVTLTSGQTNNALDGGLYQTVTIGDFVWDDLDADGKQDAGEPGINGVTVNLLDASGNVIGTTTTGSDGKYTFANLTPGTYAVQVVAPSGYLLSPSGNDNALGSNGKTSNVTLTSGQTNNALDGGLYQTVTIGDFVWDDLDADGKQDAGEPGINGVTVNLLDSTGAVVGTTTTGSDGKYTFANLTPGTYAVQVVAPTGYLLSPSGNDNALGSNGKTSNVTLTSGQTNNTLDGGLYQTVTIGDFVWDDLDADGKQDAGEPGINGVTVNLLDASGNVIGTTTTGSDGKYTFANLTPGTYAVQVVAPTGYLLSPSGNDNALGSNGKTSNVTLTSGQTNNTLDGGLYQTVTIGDFVWDDLDADGKQDAGEPGINGVTVNLLDASGNVIGTTTTGSDGKYTFANLTPGTYAVQVVAPSGYLLSPSGNDNALGSNGKTSNVTLTSGQTNNALDGGLYQTVTIGDFVWDDLDADGKQDAGEPGINGVTVNLLDSTGAVVGTTTTGSDGKYTFANLTPGTYAVQVVAPTGYLLSPSGNDNALGSNGKTSNVTLTSGQTNNALDGGLYQTVTIGDFVWDDLDADGKQDAGEPGINGVTVNLLDSTGAVVGTTTTGSDGKYTFANLTPGTYAVQVVAPTGYLLSPSGNDNALGSNGKTSNVTLTSGQTNNALDGGLYQTVTIGDFVWDDLDADGKQDAGEPGINGVTVNLLDSTGAVVGTTTTGSDGKYTFANLTPGTYAVQVVAPSGYLLSPSGNDNALGSNGKTSNVTLTSGQTNNTLDGGLYQTVTIGDFVWDDLDADGKQDAGEPGINGVTVNLLDSTGAVVGTTTTGSDGKYTFANLTPGTYAVQVVAPSGYLLSPSGNDNALGSNGKTSNVTLTSGQTNNALDGGLYQTVTIGDFVWDDLDADGKQDAGEPGINGVTVNLLDSTGAVVGTTTTGSDGKYTFANLTPGTYAVQVVAPSGYLLSPSGNDNALGSNGKTSNVTLTSGQTNNALDGGLYQTVTIGDFVWDDLDADGKQDAGEPGINGVTVNLLDSTGAVVGTTTTGSDGKYTFANLTPGTYAVQVVAPSGYLLSPSGNDNALGSNGKTSNVTLTSGQTNNTLDGGLYQTVTIGDFVWDDLDADGKQDAGEPGINGVTVNLLDSTGAVVGTTTTGSDGKYTFANLTPGTYAVQVVAPSGYLLSPSGNDNALGSNGKTSNVTLTSGQTNNALDGGLYQTVTIGDFVWDDLDADGKQDAGEPGINGVTVNLLDSTGAVVGTTTTGSDGKYTFANLTPGTYAVQVVAPSGYLLSPSGNDNALGSNGKTSNVTLTSGQTNNALDGGLYQTVTIGDFVWDDLDADGKQDAGEPGINGVTVNLLDSTGAVVGTTTTGSDGKYTFANLTPGTYAVQVVAPSGYLLSPSGNDNALGSNGKTSNVTLTSGQTNNALDGGLYQTVTIGDFVWDDLDADGKQDAGEPGINGVTVNLLDSTGAVVGTTTTGSDGKYTFANLTPGTYAVQVIAPTEFVFSPANLGDHALDINGKTANVTLTSGQTNIALDGALHKLVTLGNSIWHDLDGDGVQDAGEPGLDGVTVNLLDASGNVIATTTTANGGKYLFSDLTPGTYAIRVDAPSGFVVTNANQGSDDTLDSDADATGNLPSVTLQSGGIDLTLDGGLVQLGKVQGTVWFDKDRDGVLDGGEKGLPGVQLTLLDANGQVVATTTTKSDGTYEFSGVRPGSYTVVETQPNGYSSSTPNSLVTVLTSGQTLQRDFGETLSNFAGSVYVDANSNGRRDTGEPGIAGVTVILTGTDANGVTVNRTVLTGADGSYQFADLLSGNYTITERQPAGYRDGLERVGTAGGIVGNDVIRSIQLGAGIDATGYTFGEIGGPVTGKVFVDPDRDGIIDPGEKGIGGVTVVLRDVTGKTVATTRTTTDGTYTFNNVPPGKYTVVQTQPPGYGTTTTNTVTINVPPTGVPNVNFGESLSKLSGVVFSDNNLDGRWQAGTEKGIGGVTITLTGTDVNGRTVTRTTRTDGAGAYFFDNLFAGNYTVRETQPSNYYEGKTTAGSRGGSVSLNKIAGINLPAGVSSTNNLFGEIPPADPFGYVYQDLNKNGRRDTGEPGISGVQITISGTAFAGTAQARPLVGSDIPGGKLTILTDATGKWEVGKMPPGIYAVTEKQPANFADGLEQNGDRNQPNTVVVGNDRFSNIVLMPNPVRGPFNFGELVPTPAPRLSSITGSVYHDVNGNGSRDANEAPIGGVRMLLTGTDTRGQSHRLTTTTASDGTYRFANLQAGTYEVVESQPSGYLDGSTLVGSAGGVRGMNTVTRIVLAEGMNAQSYVFGEITPNLPPLPNPPAPQPTVPTADPSKQFFLASQEALARLSQQAGATPTAPGASADSSAYFPTFSSNGAEEFLMQTGTAAMPALVATAMATPEGGLVRVFDYTSNVERFRFTPYSSNYRGEIRVATGDVDGDGIADIATAPGQGGASHVRVFNGISGAVMAEYFAYDPSFTGGTSVSIADVDGDGRGEIITGTGVGGGPHVRVISALTGIGVRDFFAYNPSFRGGVNVAAGDLDGDGRAEVVTGAGVGGAPLVQVFSGATGAQITQFLTSNIDFRGGVKVAVGDTDGDGAADIITGAGEGASPLVQVFGIDGRKIREFLAYDNSYTGGVNVGAQDTNGDGKADIMTGNAEGTASHVRLFSGADGEVLENFFASPITLVGGVFVG